MTPREDSPQSPRFQVERSARFASDIGEAEEHAAEQALIDAVVARMPVNLRAAARDALAQNGMPVGADDPETARLLQRIASIRVKRLQRARAQRETVPHVEKVRILLALVSNLGDEIAVVVRRPTDGGLPLLLLNAASVRASDLPAATRMAAASLQQFGERPTREHRVVMRRVDDPEAGRTTAHASGWSAILDRLRGTEPRDVPGIGVVRTLEFAATPPPSSLH